MVVLGFLRLECMMEYPQLYIYIYIHALWAFPKSGGNCPQKKCCELMIGWMILGATIGGNRHMDHPPFGV